MGNDMSCCTSAKIDTVQESLNERFLTDGEKTEFLANFLEIDPAMKGLSQDCKTCTVSTNAVCSPSVKRPDSSLGDKSKLRIFSSNASGKCVNLIENMQKSHSVCSTSLHSKSNSKCASPRNRGKSAVIE